MDVIKLLEYLQEIIESSPSIPLTGKTTINKKEFMEILQKIVMSLPDELKRAQWICEEKDRILREAHEDAEDVKVQNIHILRKQIENHNITKEAEIKAHQIINKAKKDAKEIRLNARDYADELLTKLNAEVEQKSTQMLNELNHESTQIIAYIQENLGFLASSIDKSINLEVDTIKNNIKELRGMK